MFRSGMKYAGLFLVLASVVVFSSCGEESAPTLTSSRVGPTTSGYYFDLSISPSVFEIDGSASITVRVWDSGGNPAAGIIVALSGSFEDGAFVTTGANGISVGILAVSGSGSGVGSVTATLENKSVTVSYVVVPQN